MGFDSAPEWHRPPVEGYAADDLDRIPDLPPHSELIDGTLVIVSPQKAFHTIMLDLLAEELRRLAPVDLFRVRREMSVVLDSRQRPEPDLIILRADATKDMHAMWYPREAVVLAVEVVAPESAVRDRVRKPRGSRAARGGCMTMTRRGHSATRTVNAPVPVVRVAVKVQQPPTGNVHPVPHSSPGLWNELSPWGSSQMGLMEMPPGPVAVMTRSPVPVIRQTILFSRVVVS